MSQQALADAIGIDLSTINRLERGLSPNSTKLGAIQEFLRIGPYAPKTGDPQDPPLSQATFAELIQALTNRYGHDIRMATAHGVTITTMDEMPPEITKDIDNNHPTRNGNTHSAQGDTAG